jgi:hypothetical protein
MKTVDEFALIKEELSKCSVQTAQDFMKTFPCERKNYFIPIISEDRPVKVMVKGRQVGWTTMPAGFYSVTWDPAYLKLPNKRAYIVCASAQDFWDRWNRFRKIRIFL